MDFSTKPLKVAFIVGEFPDKIGTFMLNQAIGLLKLGVDVQIFSLLRPKELFTSGEIEASKLMERVHYIGVPRNKLARFFTGCWIVLKNIFTHPLHIFKPLNISRYGKTALTLNPLFFCNYFMKIKEEFDIIHCHFGQRGIYGATLKDIGVSGKLVTSFYGGDLSYFIDTTSKNIYNHLFKTGDIFLPLSENFRKRLIELGCPPSKTLVHHVGTNLSHFTLKHYEDRKKIRLLMIARFVEKKGHAYLIKALPSILKAHPSTKLQLVGDGPLKAMIEALAKDLGVMHAVHFTSTVSPDELPSIYKQADIYVLPSVTASDGDTEGTPVSIMEAQACGLPVVSTMHSGIPEIVVDGKTGFLVQEKNVEQLAEKIIYLIKNSNTRAIFGAKGREFIMEHYETNRQNEKLLELYKKLL